MTEQQIGKPAVDPYHFVRLVGTPRREPAIPHHRFVGQSGWLVCRLTARTPLFVYDPRFVRTVSQGHETVAFPVYDGKALIPSTSLKGVIRSVAEAAEASCFTLFAEDGEYRGSGVTQGKTITVGLPSGYEHCTSKEALCPACRLFGSLYGGDLAYAGKVSISDAVSKAGQFAITKKSLTLDVLSTPKPEGRPKAYVLTDPKSGKRVVRGRKFYRHRLDSVMERIAGKQDRQNKTVQPVGAGAVFHFNVEYTNLTDSELRLLLYAIALEQGLWHKIGLGKPIGLGSAEIEIVEWIRVDREARYRAIGEGVGVPLTGAALQAEVNRWLMPYREGQAMNLQDLREVLRHQHNYDVRYQVRRPTGLRPR